MDLAADAFRVPEEERQDTDAYLLLYSKSRNLTLRNLVDL
jgi:hypothetical protein